MTIDRSPPEDAGSASDAAARDRGLEMAPVTGIDVAHLFRTESRRLWRTVRRRVADPEEAHDLVQDAFARMIQSTPSSALHAPAAYLQRIVRNLLHDRHKRAERRHVFCELIDAAAELPIILPEQEWGIEAGDLMTQYSEALAALTPRTREIFLLHRVDELRYRDIAERLGITVATVEYHMARALVHLDKALSQ